MNYPILLILLCALIVSVSASAPSFCKCTCFTNSTIIPLSTHTSSQAAGKAGTPAQTVGCFTCNKAFCLSQRLPICKDAEEKDIITTCFQRDSRQDQIVVLTFITGTLGLLAWAGIRRILEKRKGHGISVTETTSEAYASLDEPR
ncbi:hypothetical protein K3495_g768 [Podosphaera aphanis]|nr:hypothetical protein K3495_g768 [Podosphaera aphanis]